MIVDVGGATMGSEAIVDYNDQGVMKSLSQLRLTFRCDRCRQAVEAVVVPTGGPGQYCAPCLREMWRWLAEQSRA